MTNAAQNSTLTEVTNSSLSPSNGPHRIDQTNKNKQRETTSVNCSDHAPAFSTHTQSPCESVYAAEPSHSFNSLNAASESGSSHISVTDKERKPAEIPQIGIQNSRSAVRSVYTTCPSTTEGVKDTVSDTVRHTTESMRPSGPGTASLHSEAQTSSQIEDKVTSGSQEPEPHRKAVHLRSLSLDSILAFDDTNCLNAQDRHYYSSSSSTCWRNILDEGLSYPLRPTYLPPEGCLTPPNLPSFGTTEAQELRLIPSSKPEWLDELLKRLRRHSQAEDIETAMDGNRAMLSSSSIREQADAISESPRDQLRHMLGLSRLIAVPPEATSNRKASLPPGIIVASVPGALARAEDGSMVRGRFGYRASGHGVGHRPIELHPWNRESSFNARPEATRGGRKSSDSHQVQMTCENAVTSTGNVTLQAGANPDRNDGSRALSERWERSSTARALCAEGRAVGELEAARKENQRLRSALAAAQHQQDSHSDGRGQGEIGNSPPMMVRLPLPQRTLNDVARAAFNNSTTQPGAQGSNSISSRQDSFTRRTGGSRGSTRLLYRAPTAMDSTRITSHPHEENTRQIVEEKKPSKTSSRVF